MARKSELAHAATLLRQNRWSEGVYCPHCLSDKINKNGVREDFIQQYICKACEKSFNDRTETIFDKTKLNMHESLLAISMHNQEFSINRMSRELNRNWRTINNYIRLVESQFNLRDIHSEYVSRIEKDEEYPIFGCGANQLNSHLQNTED